MSRARETEAEAFRKWFASQTTYESLSAMERALNITEDYLHLIKNGSRRATDPELRRKLRAATGLKEFDPILSGSRTAVRTLADKFDLHREAQGSDTLKSASKSIIEKSTTKEKI